MNGIPKASSPAAGPSVKTPGMIVSSEVTSAVPNAASAAPDAVKTIPVTISERLRSSVAAGAGEAQAHGLTHGPAEGGAVGVQVGAGQGSLAGGAQGSLVGGAQGSLAVGEGFVGLSGTGSADCASLRAGAKTALIRAEKSHTARE